MSVPASSGGSGASSPPRTRSPPIPAVRLRTTSTSDARMRSTTARYSAGSRAPRPVSGSRTWMCATAAPARAASIAASAICSGVTGTCVAPADGVAGSGDRTGDENFPVHGVLRSKCELPLHILRWTYHNRPSVRWCKAPPRVRLALDELRAAAQAFARDEMRPVALAYDETEEYPLDLLHRAAALGLTCYDLPAEYGGGGVESLRDRCEVIEELAWGDSPIFWVIAQGGFFAGPLLALGSEEQKRALAAAALRRRAAGVLGRDHRARARLRLGRDRDDRASAATAATSSTGARSSSATATSPTSASSSPPSSPAAARAASPRSSSSSGDDGFVRGPRLPKMGSRCFPAGGARVRGLLRARGPPPRRRGRRLPRADVGLRRRPRPARGGRGRASAARRSSSRSSTRRSARRSAGRSTSSRPSRSGSPTRS